MNLQLISCIFLSFLQTKIVEKFLSLQLKSNKKFLHSLDPYQVNQTYTQTYLFVEPKSSRIIYLLGQNQQILLSSISFFQPKFGRMNSILRTPKSPKNPS
ncbi:hypothetical protein KFK09_023068 [Dendrobium nobile]|uniref:Uncharacterized protein n=1 Tax=Dendrobium nobile TaxID=94219 RepID=A0A8T3AL28_DENNO|nr:hypothetical protein KFK09_023068 [Dendrobium nobile]